MGIAYPEEEKNGHEAERIYGFSKGELCGSGAGGVADFQRVLFDEPHADGTLIIKDGDVWKMLLLDSVFSIVTSRPSQRCNYSWYPAGNIHEHDDERPQNSTSPSLVSLT